MSERGNKLMQFQAIPEIWSSIPWRCQWAHLPSDIAFQLPAQSIQEEKKMMPAYWLPWLSLRSVAKGWLGPLTKGRKDYQVGFSMQLSPCSSNCPSLVPWDLEVVTAPSVNSLRVPHHRLCFPSTTATTLQTAHLLNAPHMYSEYAICLFQDPEWHKST